LVCGVVTSADLGQKVGFLFRKNQQEVTGKIVRDWLALRLLLRRNRPNVLLVELTEESVQLQTLVEDTANLLEGVRIIGIKTAESAIDQSKLPARIQQVMEHDCNEQQLLNAIMGTQPVGEPESPSQPSGFPASDLPQASASTVSMNSEV